MKGDRLEWVRGKRTHQGEVEIAAYTTSGGRKMTFNVQEGVFYVGLFTLDVGVDGVRVARYAAYEGIENARKKAEQFVTAFEEGV